MTLKIKPELKIVFYCLFVVLLFVFDNLPAYLCAAAILGLFFVKMPLKTLKSGWLPISMFLLFTFISNAVGRHGRIVFSAGVLMLTDEGVHIAAVRTLRVFLMIGGAKVLMSFTKAEEMIEGLGRLFGPLERVGLPARDFFHTMGLTMTCFPILKNMAFEAYRENMRTCDKPSFWGRARVASSCLLPLFLKSLQSPESFFVQQPATRADGESNVGP